MAPECSKNKPGMTCSSLLSGLVLLICLALPVQAHAQAGDTNPTPQEMAPQHLSDAELLRAAQNPVAGLISVPIEYTGSFGIGPHNRTAHSISLQPVIPMSVSSNWLLVTRIVQPLNWQPTLDQSSGGDFGLGDTAPTFFLVPKHPGEIIWGVGPAMVLPTASSSTLGSGKLSIGPSAVVLAQPGNWTVGALAGHVWSVAGPSDRASVNRSSLQIFIVRNLANNWYVSTAPNIVADWTANANDRWLVPIGGGIGRLVNLGSTPVDFSVGLYRNVYRPEDAPAWRMSFQMTLMFPH